MEQLQYIYSRKKLVYHGENGTKCAEFGILGHVFTIMFLFFLKRVLNTSYIQTKEIILVTIYLKNK